MAEWIQCPSCRLKHTARPDGICPRCRQPLSAGAPAPQPAAPRAPAPAPAPAPALAVAIPPSAPPAPGGWAPPPTGVAPARGGSLTAGRLIASTFTVWGQTAGAVVPLVLLVNLLPALVLVQAYASFPMEPRERLVAQSGTYWLAMLVNLFINPLELFGAVHAGVRRLQGESLSLGKLLGASATKYFPVLGAWLLLLLALAGTSCTVILPFLLLTAWAAALPAVSAEGLGPVEALRRSWHLTEGSRWPLFGALLAVELIVGLPLGILLALVNVAVRRAGPMSGLAAGILSCGELLVQSVASSTIGTCTAVAYQLLRGGGENPSVTQLRRVFE